MKDAAYLICKAAGKISQHFQTFTINFFVNGKQYTRAQIPQFVWVILSLYWYSLTLISFFWSVGIYAGNVQGSFSVTANGGAGVKGQDGGPGQDAADSRVTVSF